MLIGYTNNWHPINRFSFVVRFAIPEDLDTEI